MLIKKLQDEGKLQKLSKDQQKLTAEQNQLLMDGGKLEQQAQVRPQIKGPLHDQQEVYWRMTVIEWDICRSVAEGYMDTAETYLSKYLALFWLIVGILAHRQ